MTPRTATLSGVPNQPKTRARAIRIPDEMWAALVAEASAQPGLTVSDIVREAIQKHLDTKRMEW